MKILVIHATAGAGHMKAAEAVYKGLKKYTSHEVIFADALDHTSPFFKKLYRDSYFFMISKFPLVWKFFFGLLDVPFMRPIMNMIRRIYNGFNARKLHQYLIREQFDCIVCAHFMPVEIASALKRKGLIKSRLVVCVTDYDVHRIWLGTDVDLYAVALPWTKNKLVEMGVAQERISVTGIPTDEKFSEKKDVAELKKKLGVQDGRFTVLIATGSFGIGPIEQIVQTLIDVQVIVICGHSQTLFKTLTAKQYPNARVFGLVNNMDEMMAVSDVMVTKPGGLSISEALVTGLPMIFFSAIPGQELNNVRVLETFNVGLSGLSISGIASAIAAYRDEPQKLAEAKADIFKIACPRAVKSIVDLIG